MDTYFSYFMQFIKTKKKAKKKITFDKISAHGN